MFAVIETGGKQYAVEAHKKIKIEKLDFQEGEQVVFDKVLLIADEKTEIGTPYVEGAKVEGVVMKQGRSKKISMMRYHSKTRHRRHKGHRQPFTEVEITNIVT